MSNLLERLREKPEEDRKRYALGTSAAFTGLIFVMWLTVLNHGFLGTGQEVPSLNNNQVTQTASPLSAFSDNAASAFQQLREEFSSFDESATGTASTSESNPADGDLPNRSAAGADQSEDSAEDYWGSQSVNTDTSAQVQGVTDEEETSESSKKVPFTSRNYNPQQESDWFAN